MDLAIPKPNRTKGAPMKYKDNSLSKSSEGKTMYIKAIIAKMVERLHVIMRYKQSHARIFLDSKPESSLIQEILKITHLNRLHTP